MPRHYTPQDQEFALERLVANRGDIARTAAELGIASRTLYNWRKRSEFSDSEELKLKNLPNFSPNSPVTPSPYAVGSGLGGGDGLPADDLQALRDLKTRMLDLTDYIVANDEIKRAIDAAPLNQRIAALVQLIDRIIKLAAQLPLDDDEMELSDDVEEVDDEEDA